MNLPKILRPVLADIRHQSETGKHQWYEVVYHDGEKWCHYAGGDTFNDGESVKQWKYADECLPKESIPTEPESWDNYLQFNEFATKEHVIGFIKQNFECRPFVNMRK